MKKLLLCLTAFFFLSCSSVLWAAESLGDLEITMEVIDEEVDNSEEVTNRLDLPLFLRNRQQQQKRLNNKQPEGESSREMREQAQEQRSHSQQAKEQTQDLKGKIAEAREQANEAKEQLGQGAGGSQPGKGKGGN